MKLLKPRVDTCQGLVIFVTEDGEKIVLQGGEETVFVAQCLVDCGDKDLLDLAFRHRSGIAEQTGVFQPAHAAPDDGFLHMIVPVDFAKYLATVTADNHLSKAKHKALIATKRSVLPNRTGMDDTASDMFFLYLHENFTRDNRLVCSPGQGIESTQTFCTTVYKVLVFLI